MQPKQETAVGRFHSISFIGLLSIWVKTLVPRGNLFCRTVNSRSLIMGQALGYLKFGLFDNKKTLFHVWF
jgi:hypothetical protein